MKKYDPADFHYYQRDSRRASPGTTVLINNQSEEPAKQLPTSENSTVKASIKDEAHQLELAKKDGLLSGEAVDGMTPPTKKYTYRVAVDQPDSSGYFTITNYV